MHGTHLAFTLSRRHFILTAATAAGDFMIGIGGAPRPAQAAVVTAEPWDTGSGYSPNDIDAWIAIDPDNSILIRYQRSGIGQGNMTALPMMITEELQCDWSKVRRVCLVQPQCPREQSLVTCSHTAACQCGSRRRGCSRSAPALVSA